MSELTLSDIKRACSRCRQFGMPEVVILSPYMLAEMKAWQALEDDIKRMTPRVRKQFLLKRKILNRRQIKAQNRKYGYDY